ncbi:MAG: hypothetical protein JWP44_4944 [Mucilaginibacter sp.]|nr:hypothetical protein [Mucilaginibacter sp.]
MDGQLEHPSIPALENIHPFLSRRGNVIGIMPLLRIAGCLVILLLFHTFPSKDAYSDDRVLPPLEVVVCLLPSETFLGRRYRPFSPRIDSVVFLPRWEVVGCIVILLLTHTFTGGRTR